MTDREAFEAWCVSKGISIERDGFGGYDSHWTEGALEGWQAALQSQQAAAEPVAWTVQMGIDLLKSGASITVFPESGERDVPLYTAEALAARVAQMQGEIGELKALSMELAGIVRACIDRETALRDKVAQLEQDARRYRAIREGLVVDPDNSGIVVSRVDDFGGETLRGDAADAAIDAAMKGSGQ